MAAASSKPRRSPERAAKVLDRAARMQQFRPGLFDRRIGDKQMRTPGKGDSPFGGMNRLDPSLLKGKGEQLIPISKIRSEQPTISVAAAKAKLTNSSGSSKMPQVVNHNGTYWVADGNHRITAARALGETHIKAQVADLRGDIKGPLIKTGQVVKGIGIASNIAGPLAVAANASLAWSAAKANGKSNATAAVDATVAGGKTAATGIAIGAGVKAAAQAGLKSAAIIGRAALPLSVAGHAAAYAFQSWRRGDSGLDILAAAGRGAINGVLPIDLTTQAIASYQQAKEAPGASKTAASPPPGGDPRLTSVQKDQYRTATAHQPQPGQEQDQAASDANRNTKRGTQNPANLEAIIKNRAAKAANPSE